MNMIELILTHDGSKWTARNNDVVVSAPTLDQLDKEVGRLLRQAGLVPAGQTVWVFMAFDNSTIPQWIRQYTQHYFNRIVDV